jgi:chromosome segregation ATPase
LLQVIDRITARRDALQAQIDRVRLIYADLEVQRDQALSLLARAQRELDAMAGGLQELQALLAAAREEQDEQRQHGDGVGSSDEQYEQHEANGHSDSPS